MKYTFRKIASVLASVLMVSSTVGIAAASYPDPFVKNGAANVAVVYDGDLNLDSTAVLDIQTSLSNALASQSAASGSTVTGGDAVKIERSNDKFNLGNALNSFYATLDDDEMSVVLADGTYLDDSNNELEYKQDITPSGMVLQNFLDSDFNDNNPAIGFNLDSSNWVMNYTLDFTPDAANLSKMANTDLEILGRNFFVSSASASTITLLDAGNTNMVSEGETKTVTVGGKTYDVSVDFVEDANTAKLTINGETTNSIDEGQTFKLTDGTYVGIKDVSYSAKDTGISKVEFSIGTGKIELINASEVKVNEDPISDIEDENGYTSVVNTYISTTSAGLLDKITLEWLVDDDAWIAPGTELVLPGFNTVKLSMGAWVVPAEEVTTIDDSSDSVRISTEIKDGPVSLSILYANSTVTGFAGLGKKATEKLVTNATSSSGLLLNETENSYFVATWISSDDAESYVYKIQSIGNDNKTTLDNIAGGSDIVFTEAGDTEDVGQIRFTLVDVNDNGKWAYVKIAASGSGTAYSNLLVTDAGMQIRLPAMNLSANLSDTLNPGTVANNSATFNINITEEDKDNNIAAGNSTIVTVGLDSSNSGAEPTAVSRITLFDQESDDDTDVGYRVSDLASKYEFYNPSNGLSKVTITYPGEESYAEVYISEVDASVTGTGVTTLGNVAVKDSEASSVSSKNLIVVGGSCVNSVAADLLGGAYCGADFEQMTGVGADSFLIQTFSRTGGNVATLVAGYNLQDTANAAKYLTTQTVDTTAGKKYKGSSASQAVLV